MCLVSSAQAGMWAFALANSATASIPWFSLALISIASFGFPAAVAVYARHYVCDLTLVRRPENRGNVTVEVTAHTFGGGYYQKEYALEDVELAAAVQGYERFRLKNAIEMGGFFMVDVKRGQVPTSASQYFDAFFQRQK